MNQPEGRYLVEIIPTVQQFVQINIRKIKYGDADTDNATTCTNISSSGTILVSKTLKSKNKNQSITINIQQNITFT